MERPQSVSRASVAERAQQNDAAIRLHQNSAGRSRAVALLANRLTRDRLAHRRITKENVMKRTLILAILLILTAACAHQQAADKPQTAPPVTETAHSTNTEPMQVVGGGGIDVKLETTPALPAEATEISSDPLVKWAKGLRDKLASPADRQAAHTKIGRAHV